MTAALRTVRLLDRKPGEAAREERQIGDVVLERGVPMPPRMTCPGHISAALQTMEVGESFQHKCRVSFDHLKKRIAGKKFAQRKVQGGYRVWRIK